MLSIRENGSFVIRVGLLITGIKANELIELISLEILWSFSLSSHKYAAAKVWEWFSAVSPSRRLGMDCQRREKVEERKKFGMN